MSALTPKADIVRHDHFGTIIMSALYHKRTFCAEKTPLFDHLIGPHGIFTDHGGGKRRATVSRSDHLVGTEDQ